jgi:chaperone LolA
MNRNTLVALSLSLCGLFCLPAFSASKKAHAKTKAAALKSATGTAKDVDTVLASYRQASALKAKIKKTVVQKTFGTEMKSQGDFYFSKGKLRMEIMEPERSTLVYDGKHIWFESRLDDQHVQVTKMKANELRKSDSLLAALFDRKDVLKNFNLTGSKSDETRKTYSFEAKDKKKSDVKFLEIALKEKDIEHITYEDQIENRVTLEFSDMTKGALDAKKFAYKPPKGAEVTEP